METVAFAPRPHERPPWWPLIRGVLVGYVFSAFALALPAAALLLLGIVGRDGQNGPRASGPLDWPFPSNGLWSWTANSVVIAGAAAIGAWLIRREVELRILRRVSTTAVFVVLLVTGYVPWVAYHGLAKVSWLFAFLGTAALIRYTAVDGAEPRRGVPRQLAAAVGVGVLATAAYGVTHPLWFASFGASSGRGPIVSAYSGNHERLLFPRAQGQVVAYTFALKNWGFADAHVQDVSVRDSPFLLVRAEAASLFPRIPARPLRGLRVGSHSEANVTLHVRLPRCTPDVYATYTLSRVLVRYRVLGASFTAPVRLAVPPTVRCP